MNQWFYFGCHEGPGHHLFEPGMHRAVVNVQWRKLGNFDGLLPPQNTNMECLATVTRLPSFGVTALAFWDYSVDKRGGSNSVIFAPSLTISPAELLAEAQTKFPQVFRRLSEPVTLAVEFQPSPTRVLTEHSGCGRGAQVDQLSVTLHPGDRVLLEMGAYSAALAKA